jgi:hypothetical protein
VVMKSRREPSAEDADELAVWCGGCARFLDVQLPHQTAQGVLNEHYERVHGEMGLFPICGRAMFRGPEWSDVTVSDCA